MRDFCFACVPTLFEVGDKKIELEINVCDNGDNMIEWEMNMANNDE